MSRFLAIAILATGLTSANGQNAVPEVAEMLKRAEPIRPGTRDMVWRGIPWYTDAAAALATARKENRPLFVWLAGGRDRDGNPLERC